MTAWRPRQVWLAWVHDVWTFVCYAAHRFFEDRCPQSAAALTYTVLLSMVPLMTITLGIMSAFPAFEAVRQSAQTLIFENFVPQVGRVVEEHLESFTAAAGRLTAVGVVGLVVSAVLMLSTIEGAFNDIWRVKEPRPWSIRLLTFWAVLTLTPLLFGASLSLSFQIFDAAHLGAGGSIWRPLIGGLPLFFEFLGFTLLYRTIPNRPVRWMDAALGAGLAAVAFEISKTGFALYLVAFPTYQSIYGALSTIPIFLVWLYLAWSIVLIGALVAAALPDWRAGRILGTAAVIEGLLPGPRLTIAVAVLRELAAAARLGIAVTRRTLLHRVPVGAAMIDGTLAQLRHARFVERSASDGWLLSRDLTAATLHDLVKSLGIGLRGPVGGIPGIEGEAIRRLDELLCRADATQGEILGITLAALLQEGAAEQPHPQTLAQTVAARRIEQRR